MQNFTLTPWSLREGKTWNLAVFWTTEKKIPYQPFHSLQESWAAQTSCRMPVKLFSRHSIMRNAEFEKLDTAIPSATASSTQSRFFLLVGATVKIIPFAVDSLRVRCCSPFSRKCFHDWMQRGNDTSPIRTCDRFRLKTAVAQHWEERAAFRPTVSPFFPRRGGWL